MVSFPPCKINLGLQVLSKETDDFHSIATCFYPVPWTDVLEILPSDSQKFSQTGISIPGAAMDNLCLRAYDVLRKDFELPPVHIHLHKIIPTGAGLGGGSSDAAHTLRILNSLFSLNLSLQQLMKYATLLGSDVSFFIQDRPMIGRGRGNVLYPVSVNLQGLYIRVFKPDISVSTAEAYAHIVPRKPDHDIQNIVEQSLTSWKEGLKNDFEASVFKKYPLIQRLKDEMYASGALYASMSGSGSSVFGLFESEKTRTTYSLKPGWSGWL